jgi:hypothetical protein
MATYKLQRNYYLSIQPNTLGSSTAPFNPNGIPFSPANAQNVIIQPPFTIEIDITRGRLGSLNNANIRIYNLGLSTRNRILKDFSDIDNTRTMFLQAGYGPTANLPLVFFGTIWSCYSKREGTEFITEITSQAGGSAPGKIFQGNSNFSAGTATDVIIKALVQNLALQTGLQAGFIASFPEPVKTPYIPQGYLAKQINTLSGGALWYDNYHINVYDATKSKPPAGPIPIIDTSMGLLETPTREQSNILIPILFEPEIEPGQQINLQSTTLETVQNPNSQLASYNGIQTVQNVHHSGIISDVVSGDLKTELSVIIGQHTS